MRARDTITTLVGRTIPSARASRKSATVLPASSERVAWAAFSAGRVARAAVLRARCWRPRAWPPFFAAVRRLDAADEEEDFAERLEAEREPERPEAEREPEPLELRALDRAAPERPEAERAELEREDDPRAEDDEPRAVRAERPLPDEDRPPEPDWRPELDPRLELDLRVPPAPPDELLRPWAILSLPSSADCRRGRLTRRHASRRDRQATAEARIARCRATS